MTTNHLPTAASIFAMMMNGSFRKMNEEDYIGYAGVSERAYIYNGDNIIIIADYYEPHLSVQVWDQDDNWWEVNLTTGEFKSI